MLAGSGSDSASWSSAMCTRGSKCSLNFGKKFCIRGVSIQIRRIQRLLTLIAGSPSFFCRKVGTCTGHFCDFPMLYCTPGSCVMFSGSISEHELSRGQLSLSQIVLIQRSHRSTFDICCGIDLPLVRSDRVLDVRCSSSL